MIKCELVKQVILEICLLQLSPLQLSPTGVAIFVVHLA